jgi:hypothetical protein
MDMEMTEKLKALETQVGVIKDEELRKIAFGNLNEYKRAERDLLGWIREKSVEDDRFLESIDDLPVTEQLVQRRERSNSAVQPSLLVAVLVGP